jgi:hypothetical protein
MPFSIAAPMWLQFLAAPTLIMPIIAMNSSRSMTPLQSVSTWLTSRLGSGSGRMAVQGKRYGGSIQRITTHLMIALASLAETFGKARYKM